MDENKEDKEKINDDPNVHKTLKTTPILILPNPNYNNSNNNNNNINANKTLNDANGPFSQCSNTSNNNNSINCVPKLSVHYIVSLNNDASSLITTTTTTNKSLETSDNLSSFAKLEVADSERKCLISLPLENVSSSHLHECEPSLLKPNLANQRLLISPTDFLTLTEEGICQKNPEVRKDVNLSASSLEIIRRNNIENNLSISLERYCESPLMLEAKDSQLICDDEVSCTGRNSRLSETEEDITTDDLFATTFGADQPSSLREFVAPMEGESARNTPTHKMIISQKLKNLEDNDLCADEKQSLESCESKPILTILDPLEAEINNCASHHHGDNTFSIITSQPTASVPTASQTMAFDIKVLPTILAKDSILLANLAAALPSSLTSRQIALQVIREDGTSLVLPLTTKNESDSTSNVRDANNELPMSTSVVLAEMVSPNESMRPYKCELCNSTFTRLGNYTRHKKIHSFPSKEDQRFHCDICSKSFIQRCDLARHLHIHRGTEPHRCPQCGKGYIRHSDLVTHQRFHNKEKPFTCPNCSKGFCQRGDLNRHLRSIHLQLKPILCSHCHKKFAKEETLLRHINATHREMVEDKSESQLKSM